VTEKRTAAQTSSAEVAGSIEDCDHSAGPGSLMALSTQVSSTEGNSGRIIEVCDQVGASFRVP